MGKRAPELATPDALVRKLMEPAARAMARRTELICEEIFRQATNAALEQAASIAEKFFVEEREESPPQIMERLRRQNKVAAEIAERIRAEKREEPADV